MAIEIRPIRDDELKAFTRCQFIAFGREFEQSIVDEYRRPVFEFERSLAAFDGPDLVATAGAFTYPNMGTPGGEVAVGGLTMVSVLSTHRRRGILSAMIKRHFEDCLARGEAMSALWASESIIYGRYGYGMAAQNADFTIERAHAALSDGPPARGTVRLIETGDAREQWPAIWDALRARTPGMIPRTTAWWNLRVFADPPSRREGFSENRYLNYEVDGELRGYLRYRTKGDYTASHLPDGTVRVEELMSLDADAYRALWEYALSLDLMKSVTATFRAPEEPLWWLLRDRRRLQMTVIDSLWLRLLDVPKALEARRYGATGALVFEVTDPFLPDVGGRFLLEGSPDGARCTRTESEPDIRLGIAELGAAYLGGVSFSTLARAGRVDGAPADLARADGMFASARAPWCPEMF